LSIAFPLWIRTACLPIVWGFLFFNETPQLAGADWAGVLGGHSSKCVGATLLAIALHASPSGTFVRGVWAALGAVSFWGRMYIPYRKAYLTGMNPSRSWTFFTSANLA